MKVCYENINSLNLDELLCLYFTYIWYDHEKIEIINSLREKINDEIKYFNINNSIEKFLFELIDKNKYNSFHCYFNLIMYDKIYNYSIKYPLTLGLIERCLESGMTFGAI